MQTLYIGQKEVKNIENNIAYFTDDTSREYTEKQLTYMVTDEPQDLTQQQLIVARKVAKEVLELLQDHNIRKGDFQMILETIVSSFNNSFNVGIAKAFGTYDGEQHILNCIENITIGDIISKSE